MATLKNIQQRHSTPICPSVCIFNNQPDNLVLSTSVPSNSFCNYGAPTSTTGWGSLDENRSYSTSSYFPHDDVLDNNDFENDLDGYNTELIKMKNLVKFYEKKAVVLVAHTVDTAANRCLVHLLWKKFSSNSNQQKLESSSTNVDLLEEIVNKSGFVKPLAVLDRRLDPLVEELCKVPQWFTLLHKYFNGKTLQPFIQCRLYNYIDSEHNYLVLIPNVFVDVGFNTFIIIDNGMASNQNIITTSNSLVNIVFKRNLISSEEANSLIEIVVKAISRLILREINKKSSVQKSSSSFRFWRRNNN